MNNSKKTSEKAVWSTYGEPWSN